MPLVKNKFPPDLLLLVFAPFVVAVIVVCLGSIIVRAGRFGGPAASYGVAAAVAIVYICFLLIRLRRRP